MRGRNGVERTRGQHGRRRVLVLAYFFPPIGGGGVQRTLKHVKYLPSEGYDPVVVTTRQLGQPVRDPSLVSDIPAQAVVLRAPELPLYLARWGFESVLRRTGLPVKLARAVGWPDEYVGWAPGAFLYALHAVRRYRPDVVYSTSSPVCAHVVALAVSRVTGLPWVADFRDAWTRNPEGVTPLTRLSARLERAVVRHARGLVVADESVELLEADESRLVVIRNGVDPDDVPPAPDPPRRGTFRLAHVGMLYGDRNAAPVFAAVRNLIARGVIDHQRFELRFVGLARLTPGVDDGAVRITRSGYVDHRQSVAEMAEADALLLYQPPEWRASSGKIYEYLATGRPILCVTSADSLAARLVTELDAGACAAPDDQAAIERALERIYSDWAAGRLEGSTRVRSEALRRFSRRALARQLADVLDAATAVS